MFSDCFIVSDRLMLDSQFIFISFTVDNAMHELLFLLLSPSVALITLCCGASAQCLAARDHLSIKEDVPFLSL